MKRCRAKKNSAWSTTDLQSPLYEEYYSKIGVIPAEEWNTFLQAMRTPLPTTFRIVSSGYFAGVLKQKLVTMSQSPHFKVNEEIIAQPSCIQWYPNSLGWHSVISRSALKNSKELQLFHQFLIAQNDQGNICRQEAVSMIPPLLLDVQSDHLVLDMCAAPGSKTGQILESLRAGVSRVSLATGAVIANDSDKDRTYMLAHQTKRLGSPSFMVTTHRAELFPEKQGNLSLEFDRILCDVPCSGDGTLRKNIDVWKKWHPSQGLGQHRIQTVIAERGVQLLKVGGRMVYSTCSLNPVENEAVVAYLLRKAQGGLELIDVSSELPKLIRRPGISSWKVMHSAGVWATKYEEIPFEKRSKILSTVFPPSPEEVAKFHLERCMRLLPQDQDTGGFFVAVLRKIAAIPATVTESMIVTKYTEPVMEEKYSYQSRFHEIPIKLLSEIPESKSILENITSFYGLAETFPFSQLITRSKDLAKISLASSPAMQLLLVPNGQLNFVNTGLKLFHKHKQREAITCPYRLSQECLAYILPFITKRIVSISYEDFVGLLNFSELPTTKLSADTKMSLSQLGCCILLIEIPLLPGQRMAFCGWHGKFTLHLLVNKQETAAIRNLLELPGTPEQGSGRKRHREETVTEQQTPNQLKSNTVSNAMS